MNIQTSSADGDTRLAAVFDDYGISLPLHENGFATIYNIEGHKIMLAELGYPKDVVNLLIHMHLMGQHQFGYSWPMWENNPYQDEWIAKAEGDNPPDYIGGN